MYRLAVFDLDGTLLDTISDLSTACNVALETFGYIGHSEEEYKYFVGNGIYKLVERALPENARDKENVLRVKAVFDKYYKEHSLDQTKPYKGILEVLDALGKQGVKCAVLSNKAHAYTVQLVELMFGKRILYSLGQRESIPTKPDPVGLIEIISYFDIQPSECIYIGDSDVDMLTAKRGKVDSIGVLWGFRKREELLEAGACHIVSCMEELEQIILGNN